MGGYGQYCPIALGAEVFAERWTPIVLRNLMVGCERFGQILDGAPGLSRSVLSARLRRLERAGVVAGSGAGRDRRYRLTAAGRELGEVVLALGAWAARWVEVVPERQDPYLMLWGLSRLIHPEALPHPRVVVRFDLVDGRAPDRYWIVAQPSGCEVCVTPPGFAEDGVVRTGTAALYHWHCGHLPLGRAERDGAMEVDGPPWLHRVLAGWGTLSPFAAVVPASRERGPQLPGPAGAALEPQGGQRRDAAQQGDGQRREGPAQGAGRPDRDDEVGHEQRAVDRPEHVHADLVADDDVLEQHPDQQPGPGAGLGDGDHAEHLPGSGRGEGGGGVLSGHR